MLPFTDAKPTATATIEPTGSRNTAPRDHLIKVTIKLGSSDNKFADKTSVTGIAIGALAAFPPAQGEPDGRQCSELTVPTRAKQAAKTGGPTSVVVGVESTVVRRGRPLVASVEQLRAALLGEGYRVTVRERRECAEPACMTDAMVDWNGLTDVPSGWYSHLVCGKHNYRTCAKCKSVFVLSSVNAAGQAPSVHCEVCGEVLVAWGSSKVWNAELVSRGDAAKSVDAAKL